MSMKNFLIIIYILKRCNIAKKNIFRNFYILFNIFLNILFYIICILFYHKNIFFIIFAYLSNTYLLFNIIIINSKNNYKSENHFYLK